MKTTLALCLLLVGGCTAHHAATAPSTAPVTQPADAAAREAAILEAPIRLTSDAQFVRAGEAYFSPDMRWVIFQAVPPGESQYQMYVARTRSQGGRVVGLAAPTRISPAVSRNTCGWFSSDGRTLIFASTAGREDPNEASPGYQRQGRDYRWSFPKGMEIFIANDWQARVEAAEAAGGGGGAVDLAMTPLTHNDAYDAECSLSPDGRWVLFCSDRPAADSPAGAKHLWAMRSDGSGTPVQLTRGQGYNGGPFFSPRGKRITFRADRRGDNLLQVYVADLAFGPTGDITGLVNERRVTAGETTVNWAPFWHPDGLHLAYASSKIAHTNYELFLIRSDGTRDTRLTWTPGPDVLPAFSPDGRQMLWSARRDGDKGAQVYVARFRLPHGS